MKLKIALIIFIVAWVTYAISFMVLFEIFYMDRDLVIVTTIIQLGIFIPYRIGSVYLLLDFWRLGYFFIDILSAQFQINTFRIKFVFSFSFIYQILAQVFSVVWWIYPAIKFF